MKYFTIEELTQTDTGLKNVPNSVEIENLKYLVDKILDPAREALGVPIIVNSGFRSKKVNKAIGGASTSQHTKGEAADITTKDNKKLFDWIRDNCEFDQLIWEFGTAKSPAWVHVSLKRNGKNRKEVLISKKINGKTYYFKI